MKWPANYLASIALHALVLFALVLPAARSQPKPETPRYLELTMTAEPEVPPVLPTPQPQTQSDNLQDAILTDSAPASMPEAAAPEASPAPGAPSENQDRNLEPPSDVPATPVPSKNPDVALAERFLGSINQITNGTIGNRPAGGRGPGGGKLGRGPGGHFYEAVYMPGGINWNDAQNFAVKHGGYLATITSRDENEFVFSLIRNDDKYWHSRSGEPGGANGPWLGGFSAGHGTEGWQWVHDEGPFKFTSWLPQRDPDNKGSPLRGLLFFSGANPRTPTWDDTSGDVKLQAFIIEYDRSPLPSMPSLQ